MEKITIEQMRILWGLVSGHSTIRYSVMHSDFYQTVENHTNRMLAIAPIVCEHLNIKFDDNELNSLILVHDLPELGMKKDITLLEQLEKSEALQNKKVIEKQTIERLSNKYGDWIYNLFYKFEEQQTKISKFVKWLDKYEASRHMLEVDLFNEVPLINMEINTIKLVESACKFDSIKTFTLRHLDNELKKVWERNDKLIEFENLRNSLL